MDGLPETYADYSKIYKLACRETNSSPSSWKTHPDLRLIAPSGDEISAETQRLTQADSEQTEETSSQPDDQLPSRRQVSLPPDILVEILKHLLVFEGSLVHAMARLDADKRPERVPVNCKKLPSVYHRFHISRGTQDDAGTSVVGARHPQDLLAPLLVAKEWLFIGVHLFYGLNTFAFSSLGE